MTETAAPDVTAPKRAPEPCPPLTVVDTLDWATFAAEFWDRRPVLVRSPGSPPFVTDEVFRSAVAGTTPPAADLMPANTQFTVGRHQQTAPGGWLPEAEDGSLAGYAARVRAALDGERYALVVHGFHTAHDAQWRRQRAFFAGLWEQLGVPISGAITTLFHGSYEHSPVGVHKDRFATFMYALHGRKRMRFWSSCPWDEPVSSMLDYEPFLASSTVTDVEPGQLLYWPSSYYHVGESALSEEPATSVNVGVPRSSHRALYDVQSHLTDPAPESDLRASASVAVSGFRSVVRPAAGGPAPAPAAARSAATWDETSPGEEPGAAAGDPAQEAPPATLLVPPGDAGAELDGELPEALRLPLAELRSLTAPEERADRDAVLSLRQWTGGGFLPAPPPAARRPLGEEEVLCARDALHWTGTPLGQLCAAAGRVARTDLPPESLGTLLERFPVGGPGRRVAEAIADLPAEHRFQAVELLEVLESFGALGRESDTDAAGVAHRPTGE